ncbi:hypothetical protein [Embleya hyalina]|uniref:hypothetical protein n=1 Tax=Embleya hyalina TaxID=516124 RepID=UPI000F838FC1|nr:hypothetical protein [Embleya hyalina]
MASNHPAQATLLDGASVRVTTNIAFRSDGDDRVRTAQLGTTGYVVGPQGGVTRIDGATGRLTVGADPWPESGPTELRVTPTALYIIDTRGGRFATVNPETLKAIGPVTYSSTRGAEQTVTLVDTGGRGTPGAGPWFVDRSSGSIWTAYTGGPTETGAGPGARITTAADRPVVVDPAGRRAIPLAPDTGVPSGPSIELPGVDAGDDITVGTSDAPHVLITSKASGHLLSCSTTAERRCHAAVLVDEPGSDVFGIPVEVDGRAYIPNLTRGTVSIVELRGDGTMGAVHTVPLTAAGTDVELAVRDGLVFFNEPDADLAGIIDPTGRVRTVAKRGTATASAATTPSTALSSDTSSASRPPTTAGPRTATASESSARKTPPPGITGTATTPTGGKPGNSPGKATSTPRAPGGDKPGYTPVKTSLTPQTPTSRGPSACPAAGSGVRVPVEQINGGGGYDFCDTVVLDSRDPIHNKGRLDTSGRVSGTLPRGQSLAIITVPERAGCDTNGVHGQGTYYHLVTVGREGSWHGTQFATWPASVTLRITYYVVIAPDTVLNTFIHNESARANGDKNPGAPSITGMTKLATFAWQGHSTLPPKC